MKKTKSNLAILSRNFDKVDKRVSNLEHFDRDDFEGSDNLEDLEDLEDLEEEFFEHAEKYQKNGNGPRAASSKANRTMTQKYGKRWTNKGSNPDSIKKLGGKNNPFVALLNVRITRPTNNIPSSLPVPLFGVINMVNDYKSVIANYLAEAGVDNLVLATAANGDKTFTYTSGILVDVITVSCPQVPYSVLLEATRTDMFRLKTMKLLLTDQTFVQQFSERFAIATRSMFGKAQFDEIPLDNFRKEEAQQTGILTVPMKLDVDKESIISVNMASAAASKGITLAMTVAKFEKLNRANLG